MSAPFISPTREGITACDVGPCDNGCGRPAVPGISRGMFKYCCTACKAEDAPVTNHPAAIAERARLQAETEAKMAAALAQSREEAAKNEETENRAPRGRRGIQSAAPVVHTPRPAPPPPPRPAPVAPPPPPREPSVAERLMEWLPTHNGASNPEAMAALNVTRPTLKRAAIHLRNAGKLDALDRHNPLHVDRLFLPGTAPGYAPVPERYRCKEPGCNLRSKGRGMCNAHWLEWRKAQGDAPLPVIPARPFEFRPEAERTPGQCARVGCERPIRCRGLCQQCCRTARARGIITRIQPRKNKG